MNQQEPQTNLKRKNRILLIILLAVIAVFYALSYVKFGQAVQRNMQQGGSFSQLATETASPS